MINEYVNLVESLQLSFTDIVKKLASQISENTDEDRIAEIFAKNLAYISAWNGVGHTISNTAIKAKFGIKNGAPTKVNAYNKAVAENSKILDNMDEHINAIIKGTEKSIEYQEMYGKQIHDLVNGNSKDLHNIKFGNLLDTEEQPEVIDKLKNLIFDYYKHSFY
jgi:phage-related protein